MKTYSNKSIRLGIICIAVACTVPRAYSQAQDTDPNLPDSPSHTVEAAGEKPDSPANREITWRTVAKDFVRDQKAIFWTYPSQLGKGQHLLPTLAIVGGTAALVATDSQSMPYFRNHARNLSDVNSVFGSPITAAEVIGLPASLMVTGYVRHDSYQVGSALLAGEAYADSAVVDLAIKAVTRRKRPSDIPPGAPIEDTFFSGGKSPFKGSSFPSGHAAGAFAVATVIATRYHSHRWVPWAVYGFATAVSFSRVTTSSHFPSDVFLGAALGYTVTRFQVLRPH
ncbi:MAG TPA: phosphatase PAP2 family protein [Terriglobales bacterium]|jgi:membrane-associated phospholipid phosphatase